MTTGHRKSNSLSVAIAVAFAAVGAGLPAGVHGDGLTYTFTSSSSGGVNDGFNWPPSPTGLLDNQQFTTPHGISIFNDINNNLLFDANYLLPNHGNVSNGISGEAMWGNPKTGGGTLETVLIDIGTTVNSVAFDFAWAVAGSHAPDYLELRVDDADGNGGWVSVDLTAQWNAGAAFGGFSGRSRRVELSVASLNNDYGLSLTGITNVDLFVDPISTGGAVGAFAVDNFNVAGGPFGDGFNSEVVFTGNNNSFQFVDGAFAILNHLRNTGIADFPSVEVTNIGFGSTQFSTTLTPGGDLTDPGQPAGVAIDPGQSLNVGHPIATLNSTLPSGQYTSQIVLSNDLNAGDPDNNMFLQIRLHDPAVLTFNNAAIINPLADPELTISNAAPLGHAGATRAGAEVTATQTTGAGISVSGIHVGDMVHAGQTLVGQVNTVGLLSGSYSGAFAVDLKMVSLTGVFLDQATAIPSETWDIAFTRNDTASDSRTVGDGANFGLAKLGVNNSTTAATLLDGASSSSQIVSMQFSSDPEAGSGSSASLVGDVVDIDFAGPGDLYVLQFTYDDAAVAATGLSESDLRILVYSTASGAWVEGVLLNSDGLAPPPPAGADPYLGAYGDYLAAAGGTPELSAFGVDTVNNHLWAVLNHNSDFAAGVVVPEPATVAFLALGGLALAVGRIRRRRRD